MSHWIWAVVTGVLLAVSNPAQAGSSPQETAPAQPQEETPPAPVPEPPPRIVGQARTQEEFDAWQAIEGAATLGEKAVLAERFLQAYPDSGLTPFAHQVIARNAYQQNDIQNFVQHAEKALEELPRNPDLLTPLAFVYSESGQSQKAIDRAQQALELITNVEYPGGVPAQDWVRQRVQLAADAYYALGRSYLSRFSATSGSDENKAQNPNLRKAIEYLEQSVGQDPSHDYAYFRLGFAYANANEAVKSLENYARAVALGGIAAGPAQDQLERVYEFIKENMGDSQLAKMNVGEIVARERQEIQQELAAKQQELQAEAEKLMSQEAERQQAQPQPSLGLPPPPLIP